jgi:hypothetical protein
LENALYHSIISCAIYDKFTAVPIDEDSLPEMELPEMEGDKILGVSDDDNLFDYE